MEPWLYGHSIGVSTVSLVTAAAFWTFLWGPIGLVLSAPLTVCLAVLGKYVPQLGFFDVLLNDGPPLEPHVTYYQRLLARDQDEAARIVRTFIKTHAPERSTMSCSCPLWYPPNEIESGTKSRTRMRNSFSERRERSSKTSASTRLHFAC